MKKISNLIFFTPLISLLCLELSVVYPRYIYIFLLLASFVIFVTLFLFKRYSQLGGRLVNFLIFPIVAMNSSAAYSVLLNDKILIHFVYILVTLLLYLYLRFVYYYLVKPHLYTPSSIENISSYGNLFVVFWSASIIFGLQSFLNMAVWRLSIIALILFFVVIYQVLWVNNIARSEKLVYSIVGSLLLVELVWIVSFLPFNYNISGFIIAICYYMMIGLIRLHLIDKLTTKNIKLYLIYGFISITLVLLTSQWI